MTSTSFDFTGKVTLVTGATSGIGAAVALAFAKAGAKLVVTGRNETRGAAVRDEIVGAGGECEFVPGEVTDSAFCDRLIGSAVGRFGGLDIVVNCAGVIYHATAEQTTDTQWRETMDVNVGGVFFVCRAAVPALRQRGGV